jgi:glycine cleavage system H lipoate-binding protein
MMREKREAGRETKRVQGFNILESECIWMKAGVINFRLCDQAYDCIHCAFDKAMTQALGKTKTQSLKVKQESWRAQMRRRHADQRECRHMLSGRVQYKLCPNDYRCHVCEFDQSLDDVELTQHLPLPSIHRVLGYQVADDCYYHRGHGWARVEYAGRVRIGLDDFAGRLVGPVDEYQLPSLGHKVKQANVCFSLAREGNTADLLSPLSGTVVAVNHEVLHRPLLPNRRPYSDGWLLVVEPERLKTNLKNLFFGKETDGWMENEVGRLHNLVMAEHGAMAATGGEPVDDVYGNAKEIGWKRLVSEFLLT